MKIFVYGFANTALFFNEVFKTSKDRNEDIEWGIIYSYAPHKNTSNKILKKENIFYLYEDFNRLFNDYNRKIKDYKFPDTRDNIHRAISASKHGYLRHNSAVQEKNANIIYEVYKEYLLKNTPEYMVFPDVETADGIILLNLCKELNIEVLYYVDTRYLGESFFAQDAYETLPKYFGTYNSEDIKKAKDTIYLYLNKKRKAFEVKKFGDEGVSIKIPSIYHRFVNGLYNKYRYEKNAIIEGKFTVKILKLIPKIYKTYLNIKFKLFQKKYFRIKNDNDQLPKEFILFPLQMTPESSINTLEQYFINQERMIELLRLNMPHNFYLLVKEHPVMVGLRKTSFYYDLYRRSGVILVNHDVNTKELMQKSKLIVTVTGTVGLEAYLEDKKSLMFGPTFFSHLCSRFDSYLNIKNTISEAIYNTTKNENKTEELAKIHNISYDFVLNDPLFFKNVLKKDNINNFIDAVKNHIERINNV